MSNCKETDSFGALIRIGHQNAKDLKLMAHSESMCPVAIYVSCQWQMMAMGEVETYISYHQIIAYDETSAKQLVQWHLTHG